MTDLSAAYAMNVAENPFGDGDGYGTLHGVQMANPVTPASPASGTTAKFAGFQTHHHFAVLLVIGVGLLYLTHHVGFRGVNVAG